jgi:transposase
MNMTRKFQTVDYDEALQQTVTIEECLSPNHLARFIVTIIAQLNLSAIYLRYAPVGGVPIAPEILLGLLFYGYATGLFSSRKLEKATYESIPFRYIAGGLHPDHDTIANFRKTFLAEIKALLVQVLLVAQEVGVFHLGNVSLDGSKIHADASKSHAVSYHHLLELEKQFTQEVEELFTLAKKVEQGGLPDGLNIADEIAFRQGRLVNLAEAQAVLDARAQERYAAEQAAYEAKLRERAEKAEQTGRKPGGHPPTPPTPGARDDDQYNFTDPESRIMKNSTNKGVDQHYNTQVTFDQASLLIVANTVSNHPNDQAEAIPTLDAIPAEVGKPDAAALDNGYFSAKNIEQIEVRKIEPYIATGREPHHQSWQAYFAEQPVPPSPDATPREKMAYKLQTDIGKLIYGLRKATVELVIGMIKEVLGFRQFSLRGLLAVAGEWGLVYLAFNLKRLHILMAG